ncbi:hypothetical protein FACS1894116_02140 [Betaproteobacteria bacterium]|nr:hypothetical protein FACS1894116_02140 [Betaproteobacteria bacterium]GHT97249.1 hypothetical protein FACS1894154_00170 [Betaproteobacteria bacterium]GHU25122.1 hypothetical protein FACS189488_11330 [Betaproteobacteria bacterium]
MNSDSLLQLNRILTREAGWIKAQLLAPATKSLQKTRNTLLKHVRLVGKRSDLELIIATEKAIVEGDLEHYANSKGMISSLNAALLELEAIEQLLTIVDDKNEYERVNNAHSLPGNREKGLPLDEARQAFKSHYARLNNLDKSRLADDEKSIIDARKSNLYTAGRLYTRRQAKTLGVEAPESLRGG